jgi:cyclase
LPLGHPEIVAENFDRWGADEILVLSIDRSISGAGPDLALLQRLGALGLSTPLAYGGGIRTAAHACAVIQAGAERVCVDALLHTDPPVIGEIAALVGAQAVIGALPLALRQGNVLWRDYRSARDTSLSREVRSLFERRVISEALLIDWRHEGEPGAFDMELVDRFPIVGVPLIAFGGISDARCIGALLDHPSTVAVGIGNFLAYREHAVQQIRREIEGRPIRPPAYLEA